MNTFKVCIILTRFILIYFYLGECWVKFLQNINKSFINEAQSMLSIWLRQELEKNVIFRVQSDRKILNKCTIVKIDNLR